ncbi:hypothetical protein LUTEI9C_70364 [Luteimonas sp. 9C]|nr:hypothetical protein LUTEI9C_70364 [Luteimonas sp. 9C]
MASVRYPRRGRITTPRNKPKF